MLHIDDIYKEIKNIAHERMRVCELMKNNKFIVYNYMDRYELDYKDHPYKNLYILIDWCKFWLDKIIAENIVIKRQEKFNMKENLDANNSVYDSINLIYQSAIILTNKIINELTIFDNSKYDFSRYNTELKYLKEVTQNIDFLSSKIDILFELIPAISIEIEKYKAIAKDLKQCFLDSKLSVLILRIELDKLLKKYDKKNLDKYAKYAWCACEGEYTFDIKSILVDFCIVLPINYIDAPISEYGYKIGVFFGENLTIENFPSDLDVVITNDYNQYNERIFFLRNYNKDGKKDIKSISNYNGEYTVEEVKKYLDESYNKNFDSVRQKIMHVFFEEIDLIISRWESVLDFLNKFKNKIFNSFQIEFLNPILELYKLIYSTRNYTIAKYTHYYDMRGELFEISSYDKHIINKNIKNSSSIKTLYRLLNDSIISSKKNELILSKQNIWQIEHYKLICLLYDIFFDSNGFKKLNSFIFNNFELSSNILNYCTEKNLSSFYKIALIFISNTSLEIEKGLILLKIQIKKLIKYRNYMEYN